MSDRLNLGARATGYESLGVFPSHERVIWPPLISSVNDEA